MEIKEIFKTSGIPTITYVNRDQGELELQLKNGILSDGRLCLLTGPSKTGKTTLYNKVLNDLNKSPIVIRCNKSLTTDEFWRKALEQIDFSQIKSTSKSSKIEGKGEIKINWKWFADLIGAEAKLGVSKSATETTIREKITSSPSPNHLIPLLQNSNAFLVIEDFHYLNNETKINIFQQWKEFIDKELSVIIVGTTNHSSDLAFSNKDLIGRIENIEMSSWNVGDLMQIITKGFEFLGLEIDSSIVELISKESVGLPILTQHICLQLFYESKIYLKKDLHHSFKIDSDLAVKSIVHIANSTYSQFKEFYEILSNGIRKSKSKYNTYELLLLIFSLDPIKFDLDIEELNTRLDKVCQGVDTPPSTSINSTLNNIKKHQENNGFTLLEWMPKQKKIFMLEPAFLFYLRWRLGKRENNVNLNRLDKFSFYYDSEYDEIINRIKEIKKIIHG